MAVEWVIQLGARIRERREALNLTQRELAALLPGNVGDQQVSKWERGVHKPGDATLEHIAAALQTTVPALISDPPKPGTPDLLGDLGDRQATLKLLLDRQELLAEALAEVASDVAAMRVMLEARPSRRRVA